MLEIISLADSVSTAIRKIHAPKMAISFFGEIKLLNEMLMPGDRRTTQHYKSLKLKTCKIFQNDKYVKYNRLPYIQIVNRKLSSLMKSHTSAYLPPETYLGKKSCLTMAQLNFHREMQVDFH